MYNAIVGLMNQFGCSTITATIDIVVTMLLLLFRLLLLLLLLFVCICINEVKFHAGHTADNGNDYKIGEHCLSFTMWIIYILLCGRVCSTLDLATLIVFDSQYVQYIYAVFFLLNLNKYHKLIQLYVLIWAQFLLFYILFKKRLLFHEWEYPYVLIVCAWITNGNTSTAKTITYTRITCIRT